MCFMFLVPRFSWAQPMATGKKTWGVYSSVGIVTGMKEVASDLHFGLAKSLEKWDIFADLHVHSFSESSVFSMTAVLGRDLLRLDPKHLKRHPYYLYPYAGIGVTHLSNPIFFDSFLLKGDDMIHLTVGVQSRIMFTRNFGIMSDIRFNQNMLIDYQLKRAFHLNLGLILKVR
ncbi:MAG: hypothetical protein RL293_1524 [Bacteroidota bacterium]|jgi:hypothetical protein